jgi:hypothetical protein
MALAPAQVRNDDVLMAKFVGSLFSDRAYCPQQLE